MTPRGTDWSLAALVALLAGRTRGGILAAALVVATLASGWAWSSGAVLRGGGYNLLNLHVVLGLGLALGVLAHALLRARRPRRADVTDRRPVPDRSFTPEGRGDA